MGRIIIEILVTGLAFFIAAYLIPDVHVAGYDTALLVAVLVALANATIGAILRFFTFILDILTLGLVSFVISVLMILLVDHWLTGFSVSGFFTAALLAIAVSIIKGVLDAFVGVDKRKQ